MSLKQKLFSGQSPATAVSDLLVTVARVGAGLTMAMQHGYGKMPPPDRFVSGLESMGFPAPEAFAWMASLAEFGGGLFLAVGLLTRPSALFLAITMAVAFFVAHGADTFDKRELSFLYLCLTLVFLAMGSGRFGIDRFIRGGSSSTPPAKKQKFK